MTAVREDLVLVSVLVKASPFVDILDRLKYVNSTTVVVSVIQSATVVASVVKTFSVKALSFLDLDKGVFTFLRSRLR